MTSKEKFKAACAQYTASVTETNKQLQRPFGAAGEPPHYQREVYSEQYRPLAESRGAVEGRNYGNAGNCNGRNPAAD